MKRIFALFAEVFDFNGILQKLSKLRSIWYQTVKYMKVTIRVGGHDEVVAQDENTRFIHCLGLTGFLKPMVDSGTSVEGFSKDSMTWT